jgi:hypothetical protein
MISQMSLAKVITPNGPEWPLFIYLCHEVESTAPGEYTNVRELGRVVVDRRGRVVAAKIQWMSIDEAAPDHPMAIFLPAVECGLPCAAWFMRWITTRWVQDLGDYEEGEAQRAQSGTEDALPEEPAGEPTLDTNHTPARIAAP